MDPHQPSTILTRFAPNATYHGLPESIAAVASAIAELDSDTVGVIGFSQGGALATHLCMLAEAKRAPFTRISFCIVFGSLAFSSADFPNPPSPLLLPSLHFSGSNDTSNPPDKNLECFEHFSPQTSLFHSFAGGHVVPQNNEIAQTIHTFVHTKL